MKNFSKFALTSIAALTVASPLINTEVDAKDKISATQNIDAKVTQESQATNALKELPKSENIKSITKIIRSLILKKDNKGFTHYIATESGQHVCTRQRSKSSYE